MAQELSKIKITVDKSHLFTLGEKMYRESIEFVRELVNNAYDADATAAYVTIAEDRIMVEDDGGGMNEKGLVQFFTIGSEEKRTRSVSPRFGRKRIGQFGIGKFSALALADKFTVESVKNGWKYAAVFDRTVWQSSDSWELPVVKEKATALDREGTKIILENLTKKISPAETEKYLKQSVPLRAKKFAVFLNGKRITAKTVPGRIIPLNIKTLYGLISGEIIIALNSADVDEPGIECQVKQVFIKKELFGLEKKHSHGIGRIAGFANADFLPLISSRSDFIIDSPEYKLFAQLLRTELDRALEELKKQGDTKNLQKITRELSDIMKQVREALLLNPDFVPAGRAVARLKAEGRKKMAVAGAVIAPPREDRPDEEKDNLKEGEDKKSEEPKPPAAAPEEKIIDAKPLVVKKIRLKKLGISCGIVSLGEAGPEAISQGNMVYINQDHLLYRQFSVKRDLLSLHLLRLLTQEIVLMKKLRITAREAFDWQSKLLKDAYGAEK